jgi:hypothetical protein
LQIQEAQRVADAAAAEVAAAKTALAVAKVGILIDVAAV